MGAIIKNPPKVKIKHIIIGVLVLLISMIGMGILGLVMYQIQPK